MTVKTPEPLRPRGCCLLDVARVMASEQRCAYELVIVELAVGIVFGRWKVSEKTDVLRDDVGCLKHSLATSKEQPACLAHAVVSLLQDRTPVTMQYKSGGKLWHLIRLRTNKADEETVVD